MKILLRQALIIDPHSPFHQQKCDILVQNGTITRIGAIAPGTEADRELRADGLQVSPGWTDLFAHFCDPGYEYKETLESGAAAAAAGGYTDVLILPNTAPYLHNKAGIEYIVQKSKSLPVRIHPIGGITKNGEGKELAEMYDMHQSGALAFTDGLQTVQSAGLLLKALQYLKAIGTALIQLPDDRSVNPAGLMHEGIRSTTLGLPGKPAIAEELMVARDIELARYTGSRIHLTGLSTARSVALVAQAKKEGVDITCSVTPYHLLFSDDDLAGYDTHLKVNPPLRTAENRAALQEAVLDGTIDCIASHHLPQNRDEKLVEFEYAKNGMIGLETCFAVVNTVLPRLSPERFFALFVANPRALFGLPLPTIREGAPAVLTLFSRSQSWQPAERDFHSRSRNTPFLHYALKGRAFGIINQDKVFLNQSLTNGTE